MRPGIFVSRTREKLGRTCDQIGRTLEPCYDINTNNSIKNTCLCVCVCNPLKEQLVANTVLWM